MPDESPAPVSDTPAAPATKPAKPARSGGKSAGKSTDAPPAPAPAPTTATASDAAPAPPAEKSAKPKASKPPAKSAAKPAAAAPAAKAAAPPKPAAGSEFPPNATVIDASGLVLGRAASLIAQRLLHGETVVVINAERSVVTGNRPMVIAEYVSARAQGSVRSGPHFPRYPDRIFRRTVRGMLPHLKTRGKLAYARLHVFIGTPPGLSNRPHQALPGAAARPALRPPTTLAEITRLLGARL